MALKLIGDVGGTKSDWALIEGESCLKRFQTVGINAATAGDLALSSYADALADECSSIKPDKINYYGAGCATPTICSRVHDVLARKFPDAGIEVASDLLGAARALFGEQEGIACILGTGSNSCLYEGGEMWANVPPLGYVLGDEGSGASLGRRLVADALRGLLPTDLCDKLRDQAGLDKDLAIERVYRSGGAQAWLASFVSFIVEHREVPEVRTIVIEEFSRFILRNVELYPDSRSYPLAFAGGVAYALEDILKQVCRSLGYQVTAVVRSPLDKLIK